MEIPNLSLNEKNEVKIETRDIPLLINKKEQIVVIKKLSTGERNKIQSQCTQTKVVAGQPSIIIDNLEIQEKILSTAIVNAPFDSSLEGIKKIPAEVADYLYNEYRDFAEPSDKKKD